MKTITLIGLNLFLVGLFIFLLTRRELLASRQKRRWWLTWLAIGVITLMDEFTSVFYAPAEAHRFIGSSALVFIALTSLLMRFMSTRYTEIAEILEHHNIIGGGVYSFSYFVLGPLVSFVAVASIMVDYALTACLSSVSAVGNAISFTPYSQSPNLTMFLPLGILWFIAGLNIAGIRENARFTFGIFVVASFVVLSLIVSGLVDFGRFGSWARLKISFSSAVGEMEQGSWLTQYGTFVTHIAYCILAYSGIESVIQTSGLVREWREIKKAYWFLALTVGIATPVIAALALTAPIDIGRHETDLIPHYATILNGWAFGVLVAAVAAFTLTMAVNTAFVASSELLERLARRYRLNWLIALNRRDSLYRVHLLNATFFSAIILITGAQQSILADMYAIGLVASFCINMGSLLIYRYSMGTTEIKYHNSRLGTLILWIILVSCFGFLAAVKTQGILLWATVTTLVLIAGFLVARRRAPEIKEIAKADAAEKMVAYLAECRTRAVYIFFRRAEEAKHGMAEKAPGLESKEQGISEKNSVFITFYSPLAGIPPKVAPNHFRFPLFKLSLFQEIVGVLQLVESEFPQRRVVVYIGWPLSSWLDRLSIGVMYFNMLRLPRRFPSFEFVMHYTTKVPIAEKKGLAKRAAGEKSEKKPTNHPPSSPQTGS
ncbi:MAG: APC family permease [Desulfobaccales bacterium]